MRKYNTEWLSINRMSHVTHVASLRGGVFPDAEPMAGGSRASIRDPQHNHDRCELHYPPATRSSSSMIAMITSASL